MQYCILYFVRNIYPYIYDLSSFKLDLFDTTEEFRDHRIINIIDDYLKLNIHFRQSNYYPYNSNVHLQLVSLHS